MSVSKKRLKEIEAIRDEHLDYSDIPELGEDFWQRAERQMPTPKKGVYVRLDADVLEWLRSKGKGYQTRMNAMLRTLMQSDQKHGNKSFDSHSPPDIIELCNRKDSIKTVV